MKLCYLFLVGAFLSITYLGFAQKAVSPKEFQSLLNGRASVQLVDVRTPGEYDSGYLQGAVNIDFRSADFKESISKLDKDRPIFVYCLSGGRSASASKNIAAIGFSEVYDMKGGIMAWKQAGLPVSTDKTGKSTGVSKEDYDSMIKSDRPVLVNIFAPWCGPCKKMKPMLAELNESAKGKFNYIPLNADENDALLKSLDVTEIPTIFIYQDGKQTWRHVGLVEKDVLVKELGL